MKWGWFFKKFKKSSFFEETYPNCPIVLLHFSHTVSFPTDRKSQKLTEKVFCNLPSCRNGNGPLESNIRSASFWPSVKLFFWLLNANSMIFACHRDIENWDKMHQWEWEYISLNSYNSKKQFLTHLLLVLN